MTSLSENPELRIVGEAVGWYDDEGRPVDPFSDDATTVEVRYADGIERHGWGRRPGYRRRQAVRHAVEVFNRRLDELEADRQAGVCQCYDSPDSGLSRPEARP